MKNLGFILLVLLVIGGQVRAQGDVTLHADPRLAMVLKKERTVLAANIEREKAAARAAVLERENTLLKSGVIDKTAPSSPLPLSAPLSTSEAGARTEPVDRPVSRTLPKLVAPPDCRVVYNGKGFRVQIYSGPDRNKAMDVKMEFMRHFPAVRTYISYVSPSFRVKVGNYRNRSDAAGMLKEAKSLFTPCMIVPDNITINTY